MDLAASEIRVLGCLLEKQRTTPDAYPLTLNSLRLACNQSTNRDPVVAYQESEVRDALHRLERRGFARFAGGAGSRAPKFRHLLSERLPMDDSEQAVICVLMLRGAQTPGELKQRADRLHAFAGLEEIHDTLARLAERELVAQLPRRPGQKEERYVQLLGGDAAEAAEAAEISPPTAMPAGGEGARQRAAAYSPAHARPGEMPRERDRGAQDAERLRELAERVSALEAQVRRIAEELGLQLAPAERGPAGAEPAGELRPDADPIAREQTEPGGRPHGATAPSTAAEGGISAGVPQ